jgi:hypothetical protein
VEPTGVSARAYQGQDEVILAQINPLNLERNYFEVLKEVLRGVDPGLLTIGDRQYFIVWECINSYTDTITVQSICSSCLKQIEVSVNLKELDTAYLPEDFEQPYEVTLPVSKQKIMLRLLNVSDDVATEQYSKDHEDGVLYRYARTIVCEEDILQTMARVRKMAAKDYLRLVAFQDKFYHGPIMAHTFKCPKCGAEVQEEVPFRLDFLFPDGSTIEESFGAGI